MSLELGIILMSGTLVGIDLWLYKMVNGSLKGYIDGWKEDYRKLIS